MWMNYVQLLWYVAHSISFFLFVLSVHTWMSTRIWFCTRTDYSYINELFFSNLFPQTSLAEISRRPFKMPLIDVRKAINSPANRSNWSSTSTFGQILVNLSAVMSLTSLCRIVEKDKTSIAQPRTFFLKHREKGHLQAANYIASTMHPETLL